MGGLPPLEDSNPPVPVFYVFILIHAFDERVPILIHSKLLEIHISSSAFFGIPKKKRKDKRVKQSCFRVICPSGRGLQGAKASLGYLIQAKTHVVRLYPILGRSVFGYLIQAKTHVVRPLLYYDLVGVSLPMISKRRAGHSLTI
jgi:hypothetical protein